MIDDVCRRALSVANTQEQFNNLYPVVARRNPMSSSEREFWKSVYAAAVHSGNIAEAAFVADRAVEELQVSVYTVNR